MARLTSAFERAVNKRCKHEAVKVFELLLRDHPKKGKLLSQVAGVAIKELKYKKFRFYFVVDAHAVKFLRAEELQDLIIKFVRMSDKKEQQRVIDEIKRVLRQLGEEGF